MPLINPSKSPKSPPTSGPLPGKDAFFLHIERSDYIQNVVYILTFKKRQDLDRVMETVRLLVDDNPQLRRIIARGTALSAPRWIEHPDFDPQDHVHVSTSPTSVPMDEYAQQYAARQMEELFPMERPLWDLHVLQGTPPEELETVGPTQGSAILLCTHHCLGDAQSFLQAFVRLSSKSPLSPSVPMDGPMVTPPSKLGKKSFIPRPSAIASSLRSSVRGFSSTVHKTWDISRFTRSSLLYPRERPAEKAVLWAEAGTIESLQALRKSRPGVTINDLLLTALTLSLRDVLLRHKDMRDKRIALMIPISYRPTGDTSLGNFITFSLIFAPADEPDADRLLKKVHGTMKTTKNDWGRNIMKWGNKHLHSRRSLVNRRLIDACMTMAHAAFSNIPGPREIIYFGGQPVEQIYVCTTPMQKGSFYIGAVSYAGKIGLSIVGDKTPEQAGYLQEISDGFIKEMARMKAE